jgi:hypothetical protein
MAIEVLHRLQLLSWVSLIVVCALIGCKNESPKKETTLSNEKRRAFLGEWNLVLPDGKRYTSPLLQLRFGESYGEEYVSIQAVSDVDDNTGLMDRRKLPRQVYSSKVEVSALSRLRNMLGGSPPSASCGRSSL